MQKDPEQQVSEETGNLEISLQKRRRAHHRVLSLPLGSAKNSRIDAVKTE